MDTIYLNAEHERNNNARYKEEYIVKDADFYRKYFELVKGLDGESVETINTILKRIEILYSNDKKEIDLFDKKEKEKILQINEDFYSKIFHIDENIFSYKNYFIPKNYFDTSVLYYECGFYRLKYKEKIKKGNIIDAGAFIGDTSLLFSKKTKEKVFAFEALSENCEYIRKTIELNNVSNIEIVNKAVGSKSGHSFINKNENKNWSTLYPIDARKYEDQVEIPITSIDDFVAENNLKISLIKAHVEGMESELIKGSVETLKSQKPTLLIHMHHTSTDFFEIKPFIEKLNLGYEFQVFKPVNGSILTGTILIAEADT